MRETVEHKRPDKTLEHIDSGDGSSHSKERRGKSPVALSLLAVVVYSQL